MIRAWLGAAAISGFLSVIAATVARHLAAAERAAEVLRTGALYGMIHATALIGVVAIATSRARPDRALEVAGWSFTVGTLLFSLSLFALGLTGAEWFAWITPIGGMILLCGWASLAVAALDHHR
jgi:uncharacterized membrane protein YgdD (TMEM256/DUF423 family)